MGTLVSRQHEDLKKPLMKLGFDILFFIALVIPISIFNLTDLTPPNVRGFFCSDNSIRYPFRKSTVPSLTLFLIGIPVVIAVTCFIECIYYKRSQIIKRGLFHPLVIALYRVFGYFIVGATINQILTDTTKITVGRLRPMFLDVCLPSVACNSSIEHMYILDYECTRTSYPGHSAKELEEMKSDIRKSFPSGHASFAMYCAVFAVFYLELRMKYKILRMFKIGLQAFALAGAIYTCCTRFLDNKHHATDIVFGAIYGTTMGLFAIYHFSKSLKPLHKKRNCGQSDGKESSSNGETDRLRPLSAPSDESDPDNSATRFISTTEA
ncbi:phospholipid phosphatase 2-like isoform X2 [Styela clava]